MALSGISLLSPTFTQTYVSLIVYAKFLTFIQIGPGWRQGKLLEEGKANLGVQGGWPLGGGKGENPPEADIFLALKSL